MPPRGPGFPSLPFRLAGASDCSAFVDTDAAFGSSGSILSCQQQQKEGGNPAEATYRDRCYPVGVIVPAAADVATIAARLPEYLGDRALDRFHNPTLGWRHRRCLSICKAGVYGGSACTRHTQTVSWRRSAQESGSVRGYSSCGGVAASVCPQIKPADTDHKVLMKVRDRYREQ